MVAVNGDRRSIAKLIRFTPSELERVVDQAQASGRPVACFIRELSLGSRPRMKNGTVGDTVIHAQVELTYRPHAYQAHSHTRQLTITDDFSTT
jgi:hypothetical protein